MRKPCCPFHKMWLSSCPPHPRLPHPTSPSWSLLKGWKKRKSWWFHSNYTIIKWWFCHRSTGKTVRKQLIKADDFLSKCIILKLNPWIKIYSVIFFLPRESSALCRGSLVLFFPNTFSFCFSCTVRSYLIPTYITATLSGSQVCGLCPSKFCLVIYLLLSINRWQKGKKWSGSVHFCQGWALPIGNPITKQTWLSFNRSEQN